MTCRCGLIAFTPIPVVSNAIVIRENSKREAAVLNFPEAALLCFWMTRGSHLELLESCSVALFLMLMMLLPLWMRMLLLLLLLLLLCRQCGSEALAALVPRLVQLIKRGVGLNTRAGTANFVVQLTMRHGADMKAHTGTLIKAGVP